MAFNLTAQLNVALNTASLKNAANTINSQLKDVGAVSLGIPNRDADNLKYIKVQAAEASTAMEQFGRQSGLAAKRFVAFTVTAGAIITFTSSLKQALSAAVEFDREMVRLTQVSTDSVGQVGAVGEEVSRLSKNYGVSSKELLSTAVTLKQANLSLADTKVALEALAQAALAPSFENLKDTTEGAIAVMNQFGISAKDLKNALGAINAVAAEFAVEAQDLIEGVRKAGGAFKAAGGDLNEFLALFTSIRQTTRESAESIGTGLRTIFTRVQRNETVEALKDIGVQLRYTAEEARSAGDLGLTNQFVGPYEAVKRLSAALNELRSTDPRFSAIVEELGGYRQISKVIPLIQEFGVAQKALGVAQAGGASLALNAAQAQEAFGVKIQKVKEEFADFVRNLTNTSSFRSLIDLLLGAASAGIKLADSLKGILPVITAIAAVKTVQSITGFTKGFANTAFSPAPANQPSTFSPFLPTGNKKAYGGIIKMAKGGFVPGSGTGDKIPALLEPGEYVIPRKFAAGALVKAYQVAKNADVVQQRLFDPKSAVTEKDYQSGKFINPDDNFTFVTRFFPISDPVSAKESSPNKKGDMFEEFAANRLNAKRTKASFDVDLIGAGGFPYEVKNEARLSSDQIIASKLARFKSRFNKNVFTNRIDEDTIDLGVIGLVANTANLKGGNDAAEKIAEERNFKVGDVEKEAAKNIKRSIPKRFVSVLAKASGGLVPGVGNTDSVPLDLPIGSYVLRKSSVNSIGVSNLSRLGRAKGGVIPSLVMPGEYIYTPDETKRIGVSNLDYMNQTGRRKFGRGSYVAITPEGNEVRDTVDAASEDEARQKIRQMGYTVISIDFPKKKNKKTKITEDLPKEDPYKELKGKDLKLAQQIESQLRVPTNKAGKIENQKQAKLVVEDITETNKQIKTLESAYKQQTNAVIKAKKNEENLNNIRQGILTTLEENKKALKESTIDKRKAIADQSKLTSMAEVKQQRIDILETQQRGIDPRSAKFRSIQARIDLEKVDQANYRRQAADKQAEINAATARATQAQDNVTKGNNHLAQVNESLVKNRKVLADSEKKQTKTNEELTELKNKYKEDKDGNITKQGKVITSTYGDSYKKEVQKELDNYKKLYGEKPVGETRQAIRENVAQRMKQGYFNQLKSFSEAKGLEFDEKFANSQALQMAREAEAGRRKFKISESGEYYDPRLAAKLKSEGYSPTGEKGFRRKANDFARNLFSKENLQNNIFAGSAGLGIISSALAPNETMLKNSIIKNKEYEYTGLSAVSGGLSGIAAGASLGSFAGVPGIATGAIIGAFTGFLSSLSEAKKQISDVKIEQSLEKLKSVFEIAAGGIGKISAESLVEIKQLQDTAEAEVGKKVSEESGAFFSRTNLKAGFLEFFGNSSGATEIKNAEYSGAFKAEQRKLYAGQVSGINSFLSKQIQENVKSDKNFDVKYFLNSQETLDQLVKLSIGLQQPLEKIKKQFETFAKDTLRQQNILKNQNDAVRAEQTLITSFSALANASSFAANTLNELSPSFKTIKDSLFGGTSVGSVRKRSIDSEFISTNPEQFLKSTQEISSGLGLFGTNFQGSANVVSIISSVLPNILSQINARDVGPGRDPQTLVSASLKEVLKFKGISEEESARYVQIIVGKMGEDFTKLLNESGGDFGELSKRLSENIGSPVIKAFNTIADNLQKAADEYSKGLDQLISATLSTVQEYEKLSKIQQQQRNFQKNIAIENEISKQKRANPLGARFGEIKEGQIALNMTNIDEQMIAFEEQQSRLTGLNRGNQLDPAQIQERINQNRIKMQEQEELKNKSKITSVAGQGDYVAATNELGRLKVEAALLNQAMKNLADSTEEMSLIEQRVGKIKQEIANEEQDNLRRQSEIENRGERLLTSSPEQIQRLQAGSQLTNIAKELGGNLLRFNVEQRKAIFEYLDFSGEEGKKLKSEFLQASGFVSKPKTETQDKYGAELNQLNNRLLAAMAVREQAQSLIIRDQQTLQAQFFEQLTAQNEKFFSQLEIQLSTLFVRQETERMRSVSSNIVNLGAIQPGVDKFFQAGINEGNYDVILKRRQEIEKYLLLSEKSKTIEGQQKAATRQDFIKNIIGISDVGDQRARPIEKRDNVIINYKLLENNLRNIPGLSSAGAENVRERYQAGKETGKIGTSLQDTVNFLMKEILAEFSVQQEGIRAQRAQSGNLLGITSEGKATTKLGEIVLKLQDPRIGVSASYFSQITDDIQRLGGFVGNNFYEQLRNLQAQSNNAAQNIQNLNNQLNLLNRPINQGFQPQVNPLAPRPAGGMKTGGMVTHSSGMAGADPKIFKPIGTDVVPTMLEPGEYVVNAKATSENLPLLQALNGGGTVKSTKAMSAGGPVRYLQDGAFIGNINDPINVNRIEAEKLAAAQRKLRVDYAIIYKFATLRGSWRKNALNNSLRLQAGNSDLTKVPYGKQINDISAIVVKNNVAPWTQINNLDDTGLNLNNLDANQANKFLEMIKNRQVYGMPLAIKQVNFQQILDATEDYLRGDFSKNQKQEFFDKNINIDRSVDRYGNTKEYYKRRANLKPYFEDLLMAGSPPDKTGVGLGYFEKNYGLKDITNIKAIGFSKGGQAGKKIPAMVQPGEFIVDANMAKKNKGILDHMNSGGKVSYLNDGDFIRKSFNPGVENILQTFRNYDSGPGILNIKRIDPFKTTGIKTSGSEYILERARHYLGERIANQFSRILSKPQEDVGPNRRVMKKMLAFQDMLPMLEKNPEQIGNTAGIYKDKPNVIITYPNKRPTTLRHEMIHALDFASEKPGAKLKNSIFGSLGLDMLSNLYKPTRMLAEAHARGGEEKNPADSLKRMIKFLSDKKAADAYGASPFLGKDILGFHAQALKDLQGNKGQIPIDNILSGSGKGKEAELIKEFLTRAGKKTSSISEVAGKSYINAKAFVGSGFLNPKKSIAVGLTLGTSLFGLTGKSYGQQAAGASDKDPTLQGSNSNSNLYATYGVVAAGALGLIGLGKSYYSRNNDIKSILGDLSASDMKKLSQQEKINHIVNRAKQSGNIEDFISKATKRSSDLANVLGENKTSFNLALNKAFEAENVSIDRKTNINQRTAKPGITSRVIAGITSLFPDIKESFAEDSAKGGIFGKIQKFFGNNTKNLSSSTTSQPTSGLNALNKNQLVEILKDNKIKNDTKNIATDILLEKYNLAKQTESIKDPTRRRNIAIGAHSYENNQSLDKPRSLNVGELETLGNAINTRKAEITPEAEAKAKEAIENARKKGVEINKEFKQDKYKYKFEDEKTSTLQEFEKAQRKKLPNDFLQKELDAKYGPKVKKEIINEKGQKVEIKGRFDSKGNLINIPSEVIEKIQGRNPYLLANEIYNERRSSFTNSYMEREVFNRFAANEVPLAPEYIAKRNARIAKHLAVYQNLEMVKKLRAEALNEAQTIIQQEINANIENKRMGLNARRERLAQARAQAGGVGAQAGRVQPVQPVVAPVVQPLPAGGVAAPAGGARAQAGGVEAPKNVGQQQPAGEAPKNVNQQQPASEVKPIVQPPPEAVAGEPVGPPRPTEEQIKAQAEREAAKAQAEREAAKAQAEREAAKAQKIIDDAKRMEAEKKRQLAQEQVEKMKKRGTTIRERLESFKNIKNNPKAIAALNSLRNAAGLAIGFSPQFLIDLSASSSTGKSLGDISKDIGSAAIDGLPWIGAFGVLGSKLPQLAGPLGAVFIPFEIDRVNKIFGELAGREKDPTKSILKYEKYIPGVSELKENVQDSTLGGDITGLGAAGLGLLLAVPGVGEAGLLTAISIAGILASYKLTANAIARNKSISKQRNTLRIRNELNDRFSKRGFASGDAGFLQDPDNEMYNKLLEKDPQQYFKLFGAAFESASISKETNGHSPDSLMNKFPYTSTKDIETYKKIPTENVQLTREDFIGEIQSLQKTNASEEDLQGIRDKYLSEKNKKPSSKGSGTKIIKDKNGKIIDGITTKSIESINQRADLFTALILENQKLGFNEYLGFAYTDRFGERQFNTKNQDLAKKIIDDSDYLMANINSGKREEYNSKGNFEINYLTKQTLEKEEENTPKDSLVENLYGQETRKFDEPLFLKELQSKQFQRRLLEAQLVVNNKQYFKKEDITKDYNLVSEEIKRQQAIANQADDPMFRSEEILALKNLRSALQPLYRKLLEKNYVDKLLNGDQDLKYKGLTEQAIIIQNNPLLNKKSAKPQEEIYSIPIGESTLRLYKGERFNSPKDRLTYSNITPFGSKDELKNPLGNQDGITQDEFFTYPRDFAEDEKRGGGVFRYMKNWKKIDYKYMASGGIVPSSAPNPDPSFFVPKGTDTVPAILSPGEYVVNAKATAANLPLLQNLNKGGAVKYLYRGGDLQAINPYYAAYSGQSPGRGYIYSNGRGRTDFDIGTQGYLASKIYNPRSTANTLFNMGNYMADRSGFLNKPGYARYNYNAQILKKHAAEFGLLPKEDKLTGMFGSISFGGGPIPNLIGGLNTLSDYASPRMAGAAKFAMEDLIFQDILNNKEISRGPVGGYQMSNVGSRYISGLIGGPPADKVSLKDYINELAFSKAGNQTFQGVSANKALAGSSLADMPGSNVGIAQQAIASLQNSGLGNLSVNNTDVAATTALETIKNARMNHYSQLFSPAPVQPFRFFANGGSTTDTQPAMLTPGEFVVSKPAVDRVGTAFLDRVNNYAKGGRVGYFAQGTNSSGPIATFDSKALQGAAVNLQSAAGSLDSSSMILSQTLQAVSVSFNSANSIFNQVTGIINTASSGMYSSSLAFERAVNSLVASLDRIPKTITLNIAPLSLNVGFDTQSVLTAIQQSLSGITLNVSNMIASAIKAERNNEMGA